jgi:dihydroneopterin triphosphate diphosphatase
MPCGADQSGPVIRVAYVDVLVLRGMGSTLQVLCLRRRAGGRSPGTWEAVHAHIDEGETPVETAVRELKEEAGLDPARLYNLSRVEAFYRHTINEVVLVPVFVALVADGASVQLSDEHDGFEWLAPEAALARMTWPRVRRELEDAVALLANRGADEAEDVLRIEYSPAWLKADR